MNEHVCMKIACDMDFGKEEVCDQVGDLKKCVHFCYDFKFVTL